MKNEHNEKNKMKYQVRLYQDNTYEVISFDELTVDWISHYQGSLSDCEAWIRLTEGGYMK